MRRRLNLLGKFIPSIHHLSIIFFYFSKERIQKKGVDHQPIFVVCNDSTHFLASAHTSPP
jgi:hypothetical protein